MKAVEVRELSADELRSKVSDLRDQLFRLRVQKSMGQLEVPLKLRTVRRDLARIVVQALEQEPGDSGEHRQRNQELQCAHGKV